MKLTIIAFIEILPRNLALDDDVALRFQLTVKLADDLVGHRPATVKGFAYFFAVKKWFHARHLPYLSADSVIMLILSNAGYLLSFLTVTTAESASNIYVA